MLETAVTLETFLGKANVGKTADTQRGCISRAVFSTVCSFLRSWLALCASQGDGGAHDELAEEYAEVPEVPVLGNVPSVMEQLGDAAGEVGHAAAQAVHCARQALPGK